MNRIKFVKLSLDAESFNEHHPDPDMPEQVDQEDPLFKFEKSMNRLSSLIVIKQMKFETINTDNKHDKNQDYYRCNSYVNSDYRTGTDIPTFC